MGTAGIGFGVSSFTINTLSPVLGVEEQFGTGTSTSYDYGPYSFWYDYNVWHGLYLVSEIGASRKQITGFDAYLDNNGQTLMDGVILKMCHTTETTLPSTLKSDLSVSSGTFEFSNRITTLPLTDITITGTDDWKSFDFTTNFSYNGIDNIIITLENQGGDWETSGARFRYSSVGSNKSWYLTQDNPGPSDYPNTPSLGTETSNRPNIKLKY